MTSLVDYLQDKLNHADASKVIVMRRPMLVGEVAIGGLRVLLWPDEWRCCVCRATGPHDEGHSGAWEHLAIHRPKPKKRWWRR